jgi:hypothetical protein
MPAAWIDIAIPLKEPLMESAGALAMKLFRAFGRRSDHPLAEPGELQRVIEALELARPLEAIGELQHWFQNLRDAEDLPFDERLALIKRLDEAAAPLLKESFAAFYANVHQRGRSERERGTLLAGCWTSLAGAYAACVADSEGGEEPGEEMRAGSALVLARACPAHFMAARARCLIYLPLAPTGWLELYQLLALAERGRFDIVPVQPYGGEARSSVRVELAKLLALELAAPHELPPDQIELAARVIERFASSFAWSRERTELCAAVIDLAVERGPHHARSATRSAGRRYFGGGAALRKLAELEQLSGEDLLSNELRFGGRFSPTQLVTVVRHLQGSLGAEPPPRRSQGVALSADVTVLRGFAAICQRVTAIDVATDAALDEDLSVAAAHRTEHIQVEAEAVLAAPETWRMESASDWGIATRIPAGLGAWAKPGVLCGLQEREGGPWALAALARLEADGSGRLSAAMRVLSRKPVSVWLRVLGREGQDASNWETASGSFAFDYLRAIVLPDAPKVDGNPVLLLEGGRFVPEQVCELVMGERSRRLRLVHFVEQGADYLRASFAWAEPGKS